MGKKIVKASILLFHRHHNDHINFPMIHTPSILLNSRGHTMPAQIPVSRNLATVASPNYNNQQWNFLRHAEECQLEQLAAQYRCIIYDRFRTDNGAVVNMKCQLANFIQCPFRMRFNGQTASLYSQWKHNHPQTSPIWGMPTLPISSSHQQQQQPITKKADNQKQQKKKTEKVKKAKKGRQTIPGWRFLQTVKDENELRGMFAGRQLHWLMTGNKRKRMVLRCQQWPECRYQIGWFMERQELSVSGKHNHPIEKEREGLGGGGESKVIENGMRPVAGEVVQVELEKKVDEDEERKKGGSEDMNPDEGGKEVANVEMMPCLLPTEGEAAPVDGQEQEESQTDGQEEEQHQPQQQQNQQGTSSSFLAETNGGGFQQTNLGMTMQTNSGGPMGNNSPPPPPSSQESVAGAGPQIQPPFVLADLLSQFKECAHRFRMQMQSNGDGTVISIWRMERKNGVAQRSTDMLIFEDKLAVIKMQEKCLK